MVLPEFVPYDDTVHRQFYFELNVEYLTWWVEQVQAHHSIDVVSTARETVQEYVAKVMDDFSHIPPSEGILYLLKCKGAIVGMGALKKLEPGIGEIKRMFIRPKYRGQGYGKRMLERLVE